MKFTLDPDHRTPHGVRRIRNHFGWGGAGGKLIFLVAMLILVLVAMSQAGKPQTWEWMFGELENETIQSQDSKPLIGDSGNSPNASNDLAEFRSPMSDQGVENEIRQPTGKSKRGIVNQSGSFDDNLVDQLRTDFWREAIDSLDAISQLDLLSLIKASSQQKPLEEGKTASINLLFSHIETRRQAFHVELLDQVSTGRDADEVRNAKLGDALAQIQRIWDGEVRPAMRAVLNDTVAESNITNSVSQLPELVDKAAVQLVRDHTPAGRASESYAWFSAWDRVFNTPLGTEYRNPVKMTPLLAQPNVYRNKIITLEGEVLQIDEVKAGLNDLGIKQYYVVWIRPNHPSTVPFCLFTLMLPDGFLGNQSNWPELPIRCNARFFKIRLFNSDGPAQAPLLMSATFELQSEQEVAGLPRRWTPGFATSLPMILLIAAFALYVSWRIYGATAHLRQRKEKSRAELNKELKLLQSDPSVIPLSEKLNRLGQDDSRQNRD